MNTLKTIYDKIGKTELAKHEVNFASNLIANLEGQYEATITKTVSAKLNLHDGVKVLLEVVNIMEKNVQEAERGLSLAKELGAESAIKTLASFVDLFKYKSKQYRQIATGIENLTKSMSTSSN
jgi:hypothetical protein